MGRKKNNYNPVVSVHNEDDLKFQQYCFDHRISRNNTPPRISQLSNKFYANTYGNKDLSSILGDKIRRAGRILREQ